MGGKRDGGQRERAAFRPIKPYNMKTHSPLSRVRPGLLLLAIFALAACRQLDHHPEKYGPTRDRRGGRHWKASGSRKATAT